MDSSVFHHEGGKLLSVLTGIFGIERLQLAEDVVQEALARALQTWPYYGIPKNPAAWLTQTAKNLALDLIRRERTQWKAGIPVGGGLGIHPQQGFSATRSGTGQ